MPSSSSNTSASLPSRHSSHSVVERHINPPSDLDQQAQRRQLYSQLGSSNGSHQGAPTRLGSRSGKEHIYDEEDDEERNVSSYASRNNRVSMPADKGERSRDEPKRQWRHQHDSAVESTGTVGSWSKDEEDDGEGRHPPRREPYQQDPQNQRRHHTEREREEEELQDSLSLPSQPSGNTPPSGANVHVTALEQDGRRQHRSQGSGRERGRAREHPSSSSSAGSSAKRNGGGDTYVLYRVPSPTCVELVEGSLSPTRSNSKVSKIESAGSTPPTSKPTRVPTATDRRGSSNSMSSGAGRPGSQGSRSTQPGLRTSPPETGPTPGHHHHRHRFTSSDDDQDSIEEPPVHKPQFNHPALAKARAPTEPRQPSQNRHLRHRFSDSDEDDDADPGRPSPAERAALQQQRTPPDRQQLPPPPSQHRSGGGKDDLDASSSNPTAEELMEKYFHKVTESEDDESAARRRIWAEDGAPSDQGGSRKTSPQRQIRHHTSTSPSAERRRRPSITSNGGDGRRMSQQYLRKASVPQVGELRKPKRMPTPLVLRRHRKEVQKTSAERSASNGSSRGEEGFHYEPPPPTTAGAHTVVPYAFAQAPVAKPSKPLSPMELPSPPRPRRQSLTVLSDDDIEDGEEEEAGYKPHASSKPRAAPRTGSHGTTSRGATASPTPSSKGPRSKSTSPAVSPTNAAGKKKKVLASPPKGMHPSPPPPLRNTEPSKIKGKTIKTGGKKKGGKGEAERLPPVSSEDRSEQLDPVLEDNLNSIDPELRKKELELEERRRDLERRKQELMARRQAMEREALLPGSALEEISAGSYPSLGRTQRHHMEEPMEEADMEPHRHRHGRQPAAAADAAAAPRPHQRRAGPRSPADEDDQLRSPRRPERQLYAEPDDEDDAVDRYYQKRQPQPRPERSRPAIEDTRRRRRNGSSEEDDEMEGDRRPRQESPAAIPPQGDGREPHDHTMIRIPYQTKKSRSGSGSSPSAGSRQSAIVWSADQGNGRAEEGRPRRQLSGDPSELASNSSAELVQRPPRRRDDTARGEEQDLQEHTPQQHRVSSSDEENPRRRAGSQAQRLSYQQPPPRRHADSTSSMDDMSFSADRRPTMESESYYTRSSARDTPPQPLYPRPRLQRPKPTDPVVQYTKLKNLIPYEPSRFFGKPARKKEDSPATSNARSRGGDHHNVSPSALGRVDVNTQSSSKGKSPSGSSPYQRRRPSPPKKRQGGSPGPARRWTKGDPHDVAYFMLPQNTRFETSPYLDPYFPRKKSSAQNTRTREEQDEDGERNWDSSRPTSSNKFYKANDESNVSNDSCAHVLQRHGFWGESTSSRVGKAPGDGGRPPRPAKVYA